MATSSPEQDRVGSSRSPWRRVLQWLFPWRWALGIAAVVMLLYTLLGFLFVPWIARREAIQYVQRDLGRQLDIAGITFNPYTFTVEIRGLALREADGTPIAGFSQLRVNAELSSLLHWAWTFKEIRLEQPDVHVVVASDGTLNLARLQPATTPAPAAQPRSGLPRLRIEHFDVINGAVQYADRSNGRAFTTALNPIEFALNDFRTAPDHDNRYAFDARTQAGAALHWAGVFRLGPLGSTGQFRVQGLRASTLTSYLKDAMPLRVPTGTINLDGDYTLGLEPALSLTVQMARMQLRDFSFGPKRPDAQDPWIRLPALDVNDSRFSLADHSLAIGTVDITGLAAKVWRERDGAINLTRLVDDAGGGPAAATTTPARAPAPASSSAPAAAPWRISVGTVALREGVVDAEDRTVTPVAKVHAAPISITVKDYSNQPGSALDLDAMIGIGKGSAGARGKLKLQPLDASLDVTAKNLDLPVLQPYIQPALQLVSGRLGAQLKLVMVSSPARGQPALKLSGTADVANLVTRDDATHRNLITWKSVRVAGLDYQQQPDRLRIQRIVANRLFGRVRIGTDGKLNIAQVLAGDNPTPDADDRAGGHTARTPAAAGPSMPISIRQIVFQDSVADFSDQSVQPRFSSGIMALNGTVDGLSSDPKSRARVKLQGKVDPYAPVTIDGQINLLSAVTYTDISMKFSNMDLTTFNPYSGKFAGYSIQQGKLSTELHYQIDNRRLDAKHHIVIDQLQFGAATGSKQAVPLPIKLAVALLKDRNGVITLDLPVSGSLDDPKFRVGPIVWKLFVGLLRKVVTAPFAALGALFGHGPDLAYVDFPAGSVMLPQAQTDKLHTLAKALVDRPQLQLQIPLHTLGPADAQVLADRALDVAAHAGTGGNAGVDRAGGARRAAAKGGAGNGSSASTAAAAAAAAAMAEEAQATASPPGLPALEALYTKTFGAQPAYPDEAGQDEQDKDNDKNKGRNRNKQAAAPTPEVTAAHVTWLRAQLLPKFAPSQARLDYLGRKRADAVRDAILMNTGVMPERVFLTETQSGAAGGTTAGAAKAPPAPGAARMQLKLQ